MLISFAEHFKPMKILSKPFSGKVVENIDPKKLGRIKCEIEGIFEGEVETLPWIFPKHSSPTNFKVPKLEELLLIEFPYNDIYHPFYTGHWHNETNHDVYFDDDYPDTSGFKLDNLKGKFNEKTKEGELEHISGTKATIKEDGSLEIILSKDITITIEGKFEQTIKGDMAFTTEGKYSITATGDTTITSDGKIEINGASGAEIVSDAMAKLVGTGGTEVGDGGSVTTINGSMVEIKGQQVLIAGGAVPVAKLGSQVMGVGNLGAPVVSTVLDGSPKVFVP